MGSGDWFKAIISGKKGKDVGLKQAKGSAKSNGFKWRNQSRKEYSPFANGTSGNARALDMPVEDFAAIRIQTAFRAYVARKTLWHLKGTVRLQMLTQNFSVKKQVANALNHLHSWSKIQAQIRARRICMVAEGRLKQKKIENQLKLEAKLHDLEVEWSRGSETMEEVLARIHQREEAAVRRERAMAYAFSHQWRANSGQQLGLVSYELGKANWGWSWVERWIAARPWESRIPAMRISPKKAKKKQANEVAKIMNSSTTKTPVSSKASLSNGKATSKARRLSYPVAEKSATIEAGIEAEEANTKKEQVVS